ncbi:MFS transporter [Sciscionella sediminilitoris]|uniref:MFS transporter n=1 Tax=Sciscionella sediminilitoris TaxID=1445613 RepID=UPI00068BE65E|nr:MFS transporter [Sciscionella sp. SE31]
MDVVTAVKRSSMSPPQYLAVTLCLFCNMLDGFDLFIMGFALPHLPAGFASPSEKGWLVSIGLIGLAVGAIFLAPFADRIGRRKVVTWGLGLGVVSMSATAMVPGAELMLITRFVTGLAVGMVSILVIILAQEYASLARRNLCVGLVTLGFPLGSVVGGFIGLFVINAFGGAWQVLFWSGAALSMLGLVASIFWLPESLAFLVAQRSPVARDQISRIATRMRLKDVDPNAEPPAEAVQATGEGKTSLVGPRYRTRSLLIWLGYSCVTVAYFFVSSWTPQLIATSSGSKETGTLVGTMISVGSVCGAVIFGIIGIKVLATKFTWVTLIVAVAAQIVFALTLQGGVAIAAAVLLGMGAFGALSSYTAAAPPLYPILVRARALGFMYGISRVGAILAPLAAGYALSFVAPVNMYLTASLFLVIAALAAFVLWRHSKDHFIAERAEISTENAVAAEPSGS